MKSAQDSQGGILFSVQYLRAIAAWMVVFFHLTASLARATGIPAVFTLGAIGVDVFFVLSGFLMAMIVDRSHETGLTFLLRRFIRIAPLYYVMTVAVFAIAVVAPWLLNSVRADMAHLLMSFFFLPHSDGTGGNQPILSLGWTLNYEMFFYLLVTIFAGLFRERTLVSLVVFLAALVFAGTMTDNPGTAIRFYTDPIVLEFGFGIILYRIVFRERQASASEGIWWIALTAAVMLMAAHHDITQDKWRFLSWGIPATLLVAGGIHSFTRRVGWMKRLGDWSYSTYLVHIYLIQFMVKLMLPHAPGWASNPFFAALVLFPMVAAASWLIHTRFELPVMAWANGRMRRWTSASVANA
ncbi:MAG: acyltransferase [Notoacmeibacter sp.]|nr:acyltransferase [Notoacmeibacter sp.]